ncbi:hypothetical protein D3C87_2009880 [compost metagenome]
MHDRGQGIREVALFKRRLQIDRLNVIAAVAGRHQTFSHGMVLDEMTGMSKKMPRKACGLRAEQTELPPKRTLWPEDWNW